MNEAVIARIFQIVIAFGSAYLIALWFALIIWTYRDITSRTESAAVQIFSTLLSVVFFVPGAILYLLLRPKETIDEAFQRSVEEEYLLHDMEDASFCPNCQRATQDDFVFCPHCGEVLRQTCPTCRRLVHAHWETCAYCGTKFSDPDAEEADDEPIAIVPESDRVDRVPETVSRQVGSDS